MSASFFQKLHDRSVAIDSWLCVGLDPRPEKIPQYEGADDDGERVYRWCVDIVAATHAHAACYKPNSAFFERLSPATCGAESLRRVISYIQTEHPTIPVLLDCKRGDVGSTSDAYSEACYGVLRADGVTLSPLMGIDSIRPFVHRGGDAVDGRPGGCFVLCKTSNPSSEEILGRPSGDGGALFERIAALAVEWDGTLRPDGPATSPYEPHVGLVVGATDPAAVARAAAALHRANGDGKRPWILCPGVGAQGGHLAETVRAAAGPDGKGRALVPVSRGIADAADPGEAARELAKGIRVARAEAAAAGDGGGVSSALDAHQRDFISLALDDGVLRFGTFTLKSGRTSPYFFNAGLFRTGKALEGLGRAYARCVADQFGDGAGGAGFDVLFGPAYKGIGLGACLASALWTEKGWNVGFAYNRKEAKDHGEGGMLVGADMAGKRVLIVDDVISAGTAIRESFSLLTSVGATPVGVVVALDRAEVRANTDRISAVQAVSRDLKVPVASIVSLPQLLEYVREDGGKGGLGDSVLEDIVNYREQYGV